MAHRILTTLGICLIMATTSFAQSYSYYFSKGLDLFESDCQDAAFATWRLGALNNENRSRWATSTAYSMNGVHHLIVQKVML